MVEPTDEPDNDDATDTTPALTAQRRTVKPGEKPTTVRLQLVLHHSGAWLDRLGTSIDIAMREFAGVEIACWDNSPQDPSAREWTEQRGWLYLPSPEGNIGYGRAHNALASLDSSGAEFLLLLNPDGILFHDAIRLLVESALGHPRAALIEAAQFPAEHPKHYEPLTLETDWCSGACLLVRASVFRELQGFDPQLFMYGEDVDLSWRAWLAGWQCIYVPQARFLHMTGVHQLRQRRDLALHHQALGGLYLRQKYFRERQVVAFLDSLRGGFSRRFVGEVETEFRELTVSPPRGRNRRHIRLEPGGAYARRRW